MAIDLSTATTEDFLRALDENPEFLQAVRRKVLSQELLELPKLLAILTARVNEFVENTNAFIAEQKKINARVDTFISEQRQFNQEQRQFNQEQRQFNQEQRDTNRRLEASIGELKGERVERVVKRHFVDISSAMGYQCTGTISKDERMEMVRNHNAWDIPEGDRRSFYNADLVIRVEDMASATHYIVVEASYTADRRDTDRAIRNAKFLNRFTGCPVHAAVASLRNDHAIDSLVMDGSVFWYQLTKQDLTEE